MRLRAHSASDPAAWSSSQGSCLKKIRNSNLCTPFPLPREPCESRVCPSFFSRSVLFCSLPWSILVTTGGRRDFFAAITPTRRVAGRTVCQETLPPGRGAFMGRDGVRPSRRVGTPTKIGSAPFRCGDCNSVLLRRDCGVISGACLQMVQIGQFN
jgi:hypothetical protein